MSGEFATRKSKRKKEPKSREEGNKREGDFLIFLFFIYFIIILTFQSKNLAS